MSPKERSQLQAFPVWFLNQAVSDPSGLLFAVHSGTDETPTYIWTASLGLHNPTPDSGDRPQMADDTQFPAQIRSTDTAFTCGPNELIRGPGE